MKLLFVISWTLFMQSVSAQIPDSTIIRNVDNLV